MIDFLNGSGFNGSDTKEFRMSSHAPLDGKVAIVTGSGRGLGLAYAQELARQGAAVVINDVDDATAAEAVASIEAEGGRAVAVVAPVGPTETAKQLVQTAVDTSGGSTSSSPTRACCATRCCGR